MIKVHFFMLHFFCEEIFNTNKLEQRLDLFTFVVLAAWFLSGLMKWSASTSTTTHQPELSSVLSSDSALLPGSLPYASLNYSPSVSAQHYTSWSDHGTPACLPIGPRGQSRTWLAEQFSAGRGSEVLVSAVQLSAVPTIYLTV